MADKSLTIKEVEKLKRELDADILKLLTTFESKVGLRTGYIDVLRKADKEEREGEIVHPVAYSEDRGPAVEIDVKLNLDL